MKKETKVFVKKQSKMFFSFYKLSLITFFSSPINIFLGIILMHFILFMWLMYRENDPFILASAVGAMVVRNSMHLFYRGLTAHKSSGFAMMIRYTPAHPLIRPIANIVANFTINLVLIIVMIGSTLLIYPSQKAIIGNVNWNMFLTATFLLWFLTVLISYTTYRFVEDSTKGMIIVNLIYVLAYNLLGCAYPYHIIANYSWLNTILYFFPLRYMMNVMQAGWVNATNLVYTGNPEYEVDWHLGQNLAIPYLITLTFILIFLILLIVVIIIKVNNNKKDNYGSNIVLKLSTKYIRDIKRCTSFEEIKELRKNHLEEMGYRLDNEDDLKIDFKKKKIKG
ncbi:hypothetical protein [Spiroplasma culicicola]|uniref:Uncharacterized protein n=1 Tax=Spiroplasma culicicola AES-1 TaxID=1276246 RepID=W6A7Z3_9MOLU|nr:hypothetical protein [Spiroplasma culicicola]AHI53112.1 hypothetical protein SCULI_v1c07710 [Spiroplasma culicicola AES-1]